MKKNLGWIITITIFLVTTAIGYGQLQGKVSANDEEIEDVEEEVQTVAEIAKENSAVNREQTVQLEQTAQVLDRLIDRVYEK